MKCIYLETSQNWAEITLNRPLKKNSLNAELIQELTEVFLNFHKNEKVKGVFLTAKGSCFCAGADLNWILSASAQELEKLYYLFETIDRYPSPVVAFPFGSVFGGGIGILSVCDFVYAHEQTQFCFSELKLGLMPALIAPFILKNKPLLKDLMMSAKPFGVKEALKLQLIHGINENKENLKNHLESLNLNAFRETKIYLKDLFNQTDLKKFSIEKLLRRRKSPQTQQSLKQFLNQKK